MPLSEESAGIAFVAPYAICWQKRESKNSGQLGPVQVRSLSARGWGRWREGGKEAHEEITTRLRPLLSTPDRQLREMVWGQDFPL